jgi:exo-beta-1,3-glucanase (GH17 family)
VTDPARGRSRARAALGAVAALSLFAGARPAVAQGGNLCDNGVWVIRAEATDPFGRVPKAPMEVRLNGAPKSHAQIVVFHHKVDGAPSWPEVASVFSSGFVRLKPARVPDVPFGTSFVLGPAYWRDGVLFGNQQITQIEIDAPLCERPEADGPIVLRLTGFSVSRGVAGDFDVTHRATLDPPTAERIALTVHQRHVARRDLDVDADRLQMAEGFKIVRASSMFIAGACFDPLTRRSHPAGTCHDADAVRTPGATQALAPRPAPGFVFAAPRRPAGRWVEVSHTDDAGWQGDTPSARMTLADAALARAASVQGYLGASSDPNDDTVDVWWHDDRPDATRWTAGESACVDYTLTASADPLPDTSPPPPAAACPDFLCTGRLVAYNPKHHDPRTGAAPPAASVRDDAQELARRGFRSVTTYASTPALARVCRLFKKAGFASVVVGVWEPTDEAELRAAIRQRRCADAYVVGTEGLTFGRYTPDALESAIERLRAATGKPVTTRETPGTYCTDPGLLALGDWVFPTVHPYFAGLTDPAAACAWTAERHEALLAAVPRGVPLVIAETGLPTAGAPGLGEAGQAEFFRCLEARGVPFAFFEGHDQLWKTALPVEPHWGLFRADGTPKAWAIAEAPPGIAIRRVRNGSSSFADPDGSVRGRIENAAAASFRVAVYVRTDRWYVQPQLASTHAIARRGTWKAPIRFGEAFAALLVAPDWVPPSPVDTLPAVDGARVFGVVRR